MAAFVSSALNRGLKFGLGAGARRFSLQYAMHEAEKPCGCGADVVVPYSLVAVPLDLAGHRPYRWHKNQPWRYPPAWLQTFSEHCNQTTRKLKIAYATGIDARTRRFVWCCGQCRAPVRVDGATLRQVTVADTVVSALPAPKPRSPEAEFANRWWINPETSAG
ncbi:hypothetical protein [Burkholderia sp. MSMB1078WGS]|uniref:hypothetical protein n=1 Tax=Burkholderia sp. MSMB1078WGS TaxID=1637900 RepID=UPI0012E38057|nr:hypothetical protein [Burkholderia sp. MSMB1078WGS]